MNELDIIENTYTTRLNERGYRVLYGFNDDVAGMLHAGSKDPEITAHTRDGVRFATHKEAVAWYESSRKPRLVYSLASQALSAVIWFSNATTEYSTASNTFAIRMYADARGMGLAGDFLEAAHTDFENRVGGDVWLKVKSLNEGARRLYETHDYLINDETDGTVTMTRTIK